jgi:hypothetical protein
MKKYKKYWFYLLLSLSISLTILVINDINDQLIPQIIQDINSGVIGAILTTIITLLLLSNQTESQENLTKSSVVYEEKLKIFNSFLETIGTCLEDGKLTAQETSKIIHSFSILRIHVSFESAIKLEKTLSTIDNSFFYYDENNLPNLNKIIELYTNLTNVFRIELYGDKASQNLNTFDFENFKKVLYRKRLSIIKPNSFGDLLAELKRNSKIQFTNTKTGLTIVYEIDDELISSFVYLNNFMEKIVAEISNEITFTYEINRQIINNETYSGIPWVKLHYKNKYFAFYVISETKRILISKIIPEKKQIASLEFFEKDNLDKYKQQIIREFQSLVLEINNKNNK